MGVVISGNLGVLLSGFAVVDAPVLLMLVCPWG